METPKTREKVAVLRKQSPTAAVFRNLEHWKRSAWAPQLTKNWLRQSKIKLPIDTELKQRVCVAVRHVKSDEEENTLDLGDIQDVDWREFEVSEALYMSTVISMALEDPNLKEWREAADFNEENVGADTPLSYHVLGNAVLYQRSDTRTLRKLVDPQGQIDDIPLCARKYVLVPRTLHCFCPECGQPCPFGEKLWESHWHAVGCKVCVEEPESVDSLDVVAFASRMIHVGLVYGVEHFVGPEIRIKEVSDTVKDATCGVVWHTEQIEEAGKLKELAELRKKCNAIGVDDGRVSYFSIDEAGKLIPEPPAQKFATVITLGCASWRALVQCVLMTEEDARVYLAILSERQWWRCSDNLRVIMRILAHRAVEDLTPDLYCTMDWANLLSADFWHRLLSRDSVRYSWAGANFEVLSQPYHTNWVRGDQGDAEYEVKHMSCGRPFYFYKGILYEALPVFGQYDHVKTIIYCHCLGGTTVEASADEFADILTQLPGDYAHFLWRIVAPQAPTTEENNKNNFGLVRSWMEQTDQCGAVWSFTGSLDERMINFLENEAEFLAGITKHSKECCWADLILCGDSQGSVNSLAAAVRLMSRGCVVCGVLARVGHPHLPLLGGKELLIEGRMNKLVSALQDIKKAGKLPPKFALLNGSRDITFSLSLAMRGIAELVDLFKAAGFGDQDSDLVRATIGDMTHSDYEPENWFLESLVWMLR